MNSWNNPKHLIAGIKRRLAEADPTDFARKDFLTRYLRELYALTGNL